MTIESMQQRPARVTIASIDTGEELSAQFNPDEVAEELAVNFARLEGLGATSKVMQYKNTDNRTMSFELSFDALSTNGGVERINAARRFLLSLCYPRKGATDVSGGGPSRALLYWPGLGRLTGRITKVSFAHKRFNVKTKPVLWTAKVSIEEARDVRIFAEDVRGTTAL